MRNRLLLFILTLVSFTYITAQTVLIEENFDSFNPGDKIVQSYNDQSIWDTWSGNPGAADDALISNKFSSSPENSLVLANNQDIVLKFGKLTTGRYQIKFNILVESGKVAYFNLLRDFNGSNSNWAFQTWFGPGGIATIDGQDPATAPASYSFEFDTWHEVNFIIDLDDDFASFYFDNEEVVSFIWSNGTASSGDFVQLDAVNFYGNTQQGTSGMYIDDVIFSQVDVPEAPSNLTAMVENDTDVVLNWDAPANPPNNYILSRNNAVVASDLTTTTFSEAPYPGNNIYTVRAHTLGLGYSYSSNEAEAIIPGGIDREYVLFEIGTGTGCPFCPGASMGAVDMVENGDDVIIIKYHNFNANDPFNTPAAAERTSNYYNITGYPTSFADGTYSIAGGSSNQSLFQGYHQHYLQRKERKALYSLDVNVFHLSGYDYRAEITVRQHSDYITEQKTLHTALTETDIDFAWQNQSQVHWTCRNMFPDALGTKMDFSESNEQSMNIDFSLEDGFVKDNCEFVVFLQADPSKEVMVSTKVDLADVLLSEEIVVDLDEFRIYPNPTSDFIYFNKRINSDYQLLDVKGKIVLSGTTSNRVDVRGLDNGIYFLSVDGYPVKKLIIN